MDVVEEVKSRLGVEEVVGGYIQLKPAGRNLKAVCPFHHEKTPSFVVSPEKGIWHCFGCGEGGDIFEFVEKMEGLEFRATLEKLAQKAGIPPEELNKSNPESAKQKERLMVAVELATKYYQASFVKSKLAQEYAIKKRGMNKEVVESFRVGYAPNVRSGLSEFLKKKGFSDNEITSTGLARKDGQTIYDMFRGRLMLPLMDKNGQPVGFTGRILAEDAKAPKYINTPQTRLYDKSRYIFAWHLAKEDIRKTDKVVLVEGNMDALSSHQAGIKNVVAVSGTALTPYQLKDVARLSLNIVVAFDADSAGIKAAERAIELSQETENINLMVVALDAKDPDDLIKKDPKLWQKAIKGAENSLDWLLDKLLAQHDKASAQGKKAISNRYLHTLSKLGDPVEQEHYLKKLAQAIDVSVEVLDKKIKQFETDNKSTFPARKAAYQAVSIVRVDGDAAEEALLSVTLTFPDTRSALDDLTEEHFSDSRRQALFSFLAKNQTTKLSGEVPGELKEIENYVKILLVRAETQYEDWAPTDRRIETYSLAQRLEELKIKKSKQNLTQKIRAAEEADDTALRDQLLSEYKQL